MYTRLHTVSRNHWQIRSAVSAEFCFEHHEMPIAANAGFF